MSNHLDQMTEVQREAVLHRDGHAIVIAAPGSGKTRVITHRIVQLVEDGANPGSVVSVTFTNKAAKEMRTRINQLLPIEVTKKLLISTFHSMCARLLRIEFAATGLNQNYSIYDEDDALTLVTDALCYLTKREPKEVKRDASYQGSRYCRRYISSLKQNLTTPEDLLKQAESAGTESDKDRLLRLVYGRYTFLLTRSNCVDFDDLIMKTVLMFREHPDVQEKYSHRVRYLQVDEYQDTNLSQYELAARLSQEWGNLFVVGDPKQCLITGTQITTPNGEVAIEELQRASKVVSASGHSTTDTGKLDKVFSRHYKGSIVVVRTRLGFELKGTPEHCLFTRFDPARLSGYYTYLMLSYSKGYRVGITKANGRKEWAAVAGSTFGLAARLRQERADAIWILKYSPTRGEAQYWEQYLSVKYGLPTVCFHVQGRNLAMTEQHIQKLFKEIDTFSAADRLATDLCINLDYPHHRPQASVKSSQKADDRKNLTLIMFADDRIVFNNTSKREQSYGAGRWYQHVMSMCSTSNWVKEAVSNSKLDLKLGLARGKYWQVRKHSADYDQLEDYASLLEKTAGVHVKRRAKLTGNIYEFTPVGNVVAGMLIPVLGRDRKSVVEDEVVAVDHEQYDGLVYDLSVPHYRNYVANGIVVHNSIYKFRGADYTNIIKFKEQYKDDVEVYFLKENFRSTKRIAAAANQLILQNKGHDTTEIVAVHPEGSAVRVVEAEDSSQEAAFAVDEIQRLVSSGKAHYHEFAIIYRVHAKSRRYEELMVANGIPHQVIGGIGFYARAVVKDVLAYLRLILNPHDDASFMRIYDSPPRGFGDASYSRLYEQKEKYQESLVEAVLHNRYEETGDKRGLAGANKLKQVFQQLSQLDLTKVGPLVEQVLDITGYQKYAEKASSGEEQLQTIQLLEELVTACHGFDQRSNSAGLARFLEWVALMQEDEKKDDNPDKVSLMTCHASKGLEFKYVYLVGATEGSIPILRDKNEDGEPKSDAQMTADLEEERRVCYVGMTRAEEGLTITHSRSTVVRGSVIECTPSRFITEMEGTLEPVQLEAPQGQVFRREAYGSNSLGRYFQGQRHGRQAFRSSQQRKSYRSRY